MQYIIFWFFKVWWGIVFYHFRKGTILHCRHVRVCTYTKCSGYTMYDYVIHLSGGMPTHSTLTKQPQKRIALCGRTRRFDLLYTRGITCVHVHR